jgi:hypothetical protein
MNPTRDENYMGLGNREAATATGGTNATSAPSIVGRKKARPDDETIAAELLDGVEGFSSPASVNCFLGNIATALARKRIKRSNAVALAHVNQLILNSEAASERENQGNLNYYGLPIGMAPTSTCSSDGGIKGQSPR